MEQTLEQLLANSKNYNATCRTSKCDNADITILVLATVENTHVVCGACSVQITDLVLEGD